MSKKQQQVSDIVIPSSPADRRQIKAALDEAVSLLQQIDDRKQHLKDIFDSIKEKYDIPTKVSRQAANARFKSNIEEVVTAAETVDGFYSIIFDGNQQPEQPEQPEQIIG